MRNHEGKSIYRRSDSSHMIELHGPQGFSSFSRTLFNSPGGESAFAIPSNFRDTTIRCVVCNDKLDEGSNNVGVDDLEVFISTSKDTEKQDVTDEFLENEGFIDLIELFQYVRETTEPLLVTVSFEYGPDNEDLNNDIKFWIAVPDVASKLRK